MNLPLFPESASTVAGEVDLLYLVAVAISAFFSLLIAFLVIGLGARYRRRHPREIGDREHAPEWLELLWTAVPLAILLGLFLWGTKVFFTLSRPPAEATEFLAVGRQWMWKFQHPQGTREINDLHVPVGQAIKFKMTSEDVIHSLFVPAFRVKTDVVPGRYTTVWFKATKPGTYHLFCAEYCGAEHSRMIGKVIVMQPNDYEAWLQGGTPMAPPEPIAVSGQALYDSLACATCHRDAAPGASGQGIELAATRRAPSLAGIHGSERTLLGGDTVLADDEYLRESILDPSEKVVGGYQPIMPAYRGQISEEELMRLIRYMKTMKADRVATPAAGTANGTAVTKAEG
jgi:cytochrome c oxidase subunit II